MRYDTYLLEKFGVKVYKDSLRLLIYSYAKDAEIPIIFSHYNHKHSVPYEIEYHTMAKNFCRLTFYMSGKYGLVINNYLYIPTYGDIIIIPENEDINSRFFSVTNVDYYQLHFPIEFFNMINIINPFTKVFHNRNTSANNVLSLNKAAREAIFNKLKKIDELAFEENPDQFLAYSYLIQIMNIISSSQKHDAVSVQSAAFSPKFQSAIDYIHSNFATLSGVNEVASNLGITNTYLARLFKKFDFGTPNEYINEVRISHAKYLLDNGYSPTHACYNSGFTNYSHFATKFKKIAGTTPSKYSGTTQDRVDG